MTKILMVGDSHGDKYFMRQMVLKAASNDIHTIFQLGDFGFVWPGNDESLDDLNEYAKERDVEIIFLPGNHEDWDQLDRYEIDACLSENVTLSGFFPVRSNILYTGRVNTWYWNSVKFAVAGGAYSIDKQWRTPGHSWWPQEELTNDDIERLMSDVGDDPVDVLLTHDAPTWGDFNYTLKNIPESHMHRQKMSAIHKSLSPIVWFHGHYHRWMQYQSPFAPVTKVYGLDCNGSYSVNNVIFDIDTLEISL